MTAEGICSEFYRFGGALSKWSYVQKAQVAVMVFDQAVGKWRLT